MSKFCEGSAPIVILISLIPIGNIVVWQNSGKVVTLLNYYSKVFFLHFTFVIIEKPEGVCVMVSKV